MARAVRAATAAAAIILRRGGIIARRPRRLVKDVQHLGLVRVGALLLRGL